MTVEQGCVLATGSTCLTSLGWEGPGGQGGAGRTGYTYLGQGPGTYTFRVDRKADAYQPGGGVGGPGFLAVAYENYSYLSVADVALP